MLWVIPGPAAGQSPESVAPGFATELWIPNSRGACHRAALCADPLAASGMTAESSRELPQGAQLLDPRFEPMLRAKTCSRQVAGGQQEMKPRRYSLLLALALGAAPASAVAQADSIADFYKGKTVTIVASGGVGGPIDLACRVVARFLSRHIPGNPTIVVRNMPGGGHVLMSNYMFTQAAKDGTTIGGVVNSIPTHQVIDGRGVRFDAGKFLWLGSTGYANLMTMAWHTAGFTTIKDVFERELLTGTTGVGSGTYMYTNAMNVILGTKFKMVMGYKDSASVDLAIERGEVQARGGMTLTGLKQERPQWVSENKVVFLVQTGAEKEVDYPNVPLMHELGRNDEERAILELISSPAALGRPFFLPPEVPADRVAALRKAFAATMKDPDYIAEGTRVRLDMNPLSAERVTQLVNATVYAPPGIVAKARAALGTEKEK
jgi:tripartite-type tricarboxylate transporter receptor subunit TctC